MRLRARTRLTPLLLALAAVVLPAQAAAEAVTVTESETIPLANVPLPTCAGEVALFNGEVKLLSHVTLNDNGSFDLELHETLIANGTGVVTGDRYAASETVTDRLNFRIPDVFPVEVTFINHFQITGPGEDDNLFARVTLHLAINNNGEVTAAVFEFDGGCR